MKHASPEEFLMIIDKLTSPATKLALSGLAVSTQTIGAGMDFGVARNNGLLANPYGPGYALRVTGATSGGAATLNLLFVTDDNLGLGSPTTLWSTGALALASLNDYSLFVPLPNTDAYEQFLGWRATVGTAVFTAGLLSVEYVADYRMWRAYNAENGR